MTETSVDHSNRSSRQAQPPHGAVRAPLARQRGWPYVDKGDPWSSHSLINAWLADLPEGTRILDVGTASGTLGRLCTDSGFTLHGLEPNAEWAALARPNYADFHRGTLESAPDEFLRGYDVVVCADVVEHMADPEGALRRLLALQPDGCLLIVSVPNVANLWIRLNLLLGRFDYADRGILDRTHLRFFTRRTAIAMLERLGLHIRRVEATAIPLNLVHPAFQQTALGRMVHAALARSTRRLQTLLGYQFVAQALKQDEVGAAGSRSLSGRAFTRRSISD